MILWVPLPVHHLPARMPAASCDAAQRGGKALTRTAAAALARADMWVGRPQLAASWRTGARSRVLKNGQRAVGRARLARATPRLGWVRNGTAKQRYNAPLSASAERQTDIFGLNPAAALAVGAARAATRCLPPRVDVNAAAEHLAEQMERQQRLGGQQNTRRLTSAAENGDACAGNLRTHRDNRGTGSNT